MCIRDRQMREQMKPQTLKRVQTRLVLEEVVKAENLQVSDERLDEEIAKMAAAYQMEADKMCIRDRCINSVDRSSASIIIDKAMDAGTPVVFFNREPVEEDMNRWEKLYYVGADAKESAVLQGDILVDAYNQDTRTRCVEETA